MEPSRRRSDRSSARFSKQIPSYSLDLVPQRITEPVEIRALMDRVLRTRLVLRRALNRKIRPETAHLEKIGTAEMVLRTSDFESARGDSQGWRLSVTIDETPFYFMVMVLGRLSEARVRVSIPTVLYRAERRDRIRRLAGEASGPTRVALALSEGTPAEGYVEDFSPGGLGLLLAPGIQPRIGQWTHLKYLDGSTRGAEAYGEVRNVASVDQRPGWLRIGMAVRDVPRLESLEVEQRLRVGASRLGRVATRMALAASAIRSSTSNIRRGHAQQAVNVVEYQNHAGEHIRGILDRCGDPTGAPVVVIPPAWGKTKETLLPLAHTILACFKKARRPVSVLRFDGIRRKGESFIDPACRARGLEYHRFTFSQGVRDILATLDFLFGPSGLNPSCAVLVSFSAASVDARRAVALEGTGRLAGWINVVGAPDLQSAMRVVSGGIDYLGGYERGMRFGLQEVQGVTVDMDHAADDAIRHRLAFLDDALRDMGSITAPITWIHGRFDAWMDFERVKLLMGAGGTGARKLIEVATGHQLRSSVEAIEVFQLIASEIGRFTGLRAVPRAVPNPTMLRLRSTAERNRLPKPHYEPRRFWRDYLVGRNGHVGIELMTATSAYQELMAQQVEGLCLASGHRVVDLGSGTGSLSSYIDQTHPGLKMQLTEIDFVREALSRSREKHARSTNAENVSLSSLVYDFALLSGERRIPLADESQDAVLASLLISYLPNPEQLIREALRVLRPGGRFVLSTLRPDADTSRIYERGVDELRSGRARVLFGEVEEARLGQSIQSFMNDAARLLELEEQSVFRFFDSTELREMLCSGGFDVLDVADAFGSPSQAVVGIAMKAGRPQE